MQIEILYEDNHLLIVEKPVNMPSQADKSQDPDVLTTLKQMIKVRDNKPGNVYLGLVHRLDRPVGGAMVFAKTSKAASRLSDSLRKRAIKRIYLAVVMGHVAPEGELKHHLYKNRQKNHVYAVDAQHPQAKPAHLSYQRLQQTKATSLVEVELHTGRSHQIRVQFQASGHPLYGDQKYGDHRIQKGTQIALWSHRLAVPHPTQDRVIEVVSYPPAKGVWRDFGY